MCRWRLGGNSTGLQFKRQPVVLKSPSAAPTLGIAMVYQDLAVCDKIDVAASLPGHEKRTGVGTLDSIRMYAEARKLLGVMGVTTLRKLRSEVGSLSGGQRPAASASPSPAR